MIKAVFQIYRLRDLYQMAIGQDVHPMLKGPVQKIAIASMVQVR